MKKAIIIGATSGIGKEVAHQLVQKGWVVGIAGRREELLNELCDRYPQYMFHERIDVTDNDAPERLRHLTEAIGGMDLFLLCAGIGSQNMELKEDIELDTIRTNVLGFTRLIGAAFRYFAQQSNGGHIAIISSIAGTKGLGAAPSYSASKRFQNTYLEALVQLAHLRHLPIRFTDIRPGFVDTDLLKNGRYPMLMRPSTVASRIVKAVEKSKRVVVIDFRYRLLTFFWKLIPRLLWERLPVRTQ